jgi:hypothetical protein
MKPIVGVAFATMLGVSAVACTIGSPTYVHESTAASSLDKGSAAQKCDSDFVKVDLSTLTACGDGNGKAHCYDASKVAMGGLSSCADGKVCVPDKILEAAGGKLQSCTFYIYGTPGVCMSTAVPDVNSHKDILHQEACDPDERCIPCINPQNNEDTHTCDPQGVHGAACTAGDAQKEAAPCCHGAGSCMLSSAAPDGARGELSQDACPRDQLCAPASLVNGMPKKCSALGVDGVCLDLCFAAMLKGASGVIRGDCGSTEMCLPCAIGKSQGMPGCE